LLGKPEVNRGARGLQGRLAGLERVVARSNFNGEEAISELLEN
jgi:hypothetical protein